MELTQRLTSLTLHVHHQLRVAHITPAKISLDVLLQNRIKLLRDYGFENVGISGDANWLDDDTKNYPFNYVTAKHLTRQMAPIEDAMAVGELYKIIRGGKFDIVNTYGIKPGLFGRFAAAMARVPVIVHTHWGFMFGDSSNRFRKMVFLALETVASQFSDMVLSVNSENIPTLQTMTRFTGVERVRYLGNACDLSRFDPRLVNKSAAAAMRLRWGVRQDSLLIGMVGRLVRDKGCMEFIDAAKHLTKSHPACDFVIVGPYDRYKPDAVDPVMGDGVVRFPGFESDMPTVYAAMDVVTLPSYREGFPRSLVEAAAMGKPIVTTDTRGCREAVDRGVSGLLVPVGDSKALADAIERFITDHDFRSHAGNMGRAKALRDFDEKKLVERIATTYLDCLERKHGLMDSTK